MPPEWQRPGDLSTDVDLMFYGKRMYGKVDQVAGAFYVVTVFLHVSFFPFVPRESWLILDGSDREGLLGSSGKGMRIPLSGKSVLCAWIRSLLLLVGGFVLVAVGPIFVEAVQQGRRALEFGLVPAAVVCGIGVFCIVLFFLSYRFSSPSYKRALELAAMMGFSPHVCAHLGPGKKGQKPLPTLCPGCCSELKPWEDWEKAKACENCGKRVVVLQEDRIG